MTHYQLGQLAWIGHASGQHDGLNPYKPGTTAHSQWEKGFQDKVNEQWREFENEKEHEQQMKLL
jgi:poly(3-hydroxybutyrate) depolymerase